MNIYVYIDIYTAYICMYTVYCTYSHICVCDLCTYIYIYIHT